MEITSLDLLMRFSYVPRNLISQGGALHSLEYILVARSEVAGDLEHALHFRASLMGGAVGLRLFVRLPTETVAGQTTSAAGEV